MNDRRFGLAPIVLGLLAAATANSDTVGTVVLTNEVVCGWGGDVVRTCDDKRFELRQNSPIDRDMTVRTEGPDEGGHHLACVMTLNKRVVDDGGVIIMQPRTMIRFSHEVLSNFESDMQQLEGVIRITLPWRRDREFLVRAGPAYIVLRGTYVEIQVDREKGLTTIGVFEGSVSVTGLVNLGAQPDFPDLPPEGAMRARVYPGEQVTVDEEGLISPPVQFPPGAPASGPTVVIEDDAIPTEPGAANPEEPRRPDQICDLPRGVCG